MLFMCVAAAAKGYLAFGWPMFVFFCLAGLFFHHCLEKMYSHNFAFTNRAVEDLMDAHGVEKLLDDGVFDNTSSSKGKELFVKKSPLHLRLKEAAKHLVLDAWQLLKKLLPCKRKRSSAVPIFLYPFYNIVSTIVDCLGNRSMPPYKKGAASNAVKESEKFLAKEDNAALTIQKRERTRRKVAAENELSA